MGFTNAAVLISRLHLTEDIGNEAVVYSKKRPLGTCVMSATKAYLCGNDCQTVLQFVIRLEHNV